MSNTALDALQVVELLDKRDRVIDISKLQPLVLQKKLEYYRNGRLSAANSDAETSVADQADLAALVSSVSSRNSMDALLPAGCVYNRLYVNDPLYKLAVPSSEHAVALNSYLGTDTSSFPDCDSVRDALRYFELLAPLIRCGVLTVLPLDELHAPPEHTPVFYSKDAFRSQVPSHLHDFIHQSANIGEVIPTSDNKAMIIREETPSKPTRGISVQFANDRSSRCPPFYLLMETEFLEHDEENSQFRIRQTLDWDNPPSEDSFKVWVYQSINRTIMNRMSCVARELSLAGQLRASYQTESQFEAELCGMCGEELASNEKGMAAVNFLNASAPYLKLANAEQLARLRIDNPQLFDRWQQSLLGVASQLSGLGGDFETQAKQLFESEIRPQLDDLTRALEKAKTTCAGATLVTAGALGLALFNNAGLPFGAVMGLGVLGVAGRTLPSVAEYLAKRKGPAFIWSKLTDA